MYNPILATLGFILSPDREKTLMVHRIRRKEDFHFGKYNGLGGKMMQGEDAVTCLHREIKEEAGIICEETILRGTINWPGFGGEGEDWFGFIFLITTFQGSPYSFNDEGELTWVDIGKLNTLPMWEGDKYFLPLVFDNDPRSFHGVMPYLDNLPQSWNFTRI